MNIYYCSECSDTDLELSSNGAVCQCLNCGHIGEPVSEYFNIYEDEEDVPER